MIDRRGERETEEGGRNKKATGGIGGVREEDEGPEEAASEGG